MIDAHIHLDQYLNNHFEDELKRWREAGLKKVVAVSTSLASSYQTLELKHKYPDFVIAAIGFHPEQSIPTEREMLEWLSLLHAERSSIAAIGEVGLPHYQLESLGAGALEVHLGQLQQFAQLAVHERLPIILHAVHDKAALALNILRKEGIKLAHFHWLKASKETTEQILQAGYFVSLTPEVCYRTRDQELVKLVPLEQLLLETDGPWPFAGPFQELPTTPLMIKESATKVAQLKQLSTRELLAQCERNMKNLYGEEL